MICLLYFLLVIVSGLGVGALLHIGDPPVMVALLTAWLWTTIYGTTYYQLKWMRRLFERKTGLCVNYT